MRKANKEISLQELQKIETDILLAFHIFCSKHSLTYYLAGGSLIGAIRHKGFIPWDDDVDTIMPRPDFMKLLAIVKHEKIGDFYEVDFQYSTSNVPSYVLRIYDSRTELSFGFSKEKHTIGCWIDVFCLDGVESSIIRRKLHFREMRIALDLSILCTTKFGRKRRNKLATIFQYALLPVLPIVRLIGHERIDDWVNRIAIRIPYENSDYVGVIGGRGGYKETMLKSKMNPAILVEFEGNKVYAMANFDEYLTNLYGDYMTLPPENERVSRHEINVYWKDEVG